MKKLGFIFSILICSVFFAAAQNEGNIWYFGYNAGLDFNSGSPVSISNGQLNTLEGCASIADNNGDLLFYTDGMVVYNKNHTIMPNGSGLLGNNSSTQSSIIVKKPASSTIYYIFTVDGMSGMSGGLNYSEVDMTLNGSLGDITINKNILLIPQACEKVTAIIHQNGADFWVISRVENSDTFHSYLLTSSGVNLNPVITNIGPIYSGTVGYLKGSPDGTRIAAANTLGNQQVNVFNFDKLTGILSNEITITVAGLYPYGVEFSPNNDILYVSADASIYQYDLLAGSATAISNSMINVDPTQPAGAP